MSLLHVIFWRQRILRDLMREPPRSLPARKVTKFLESLDIKVIEDADSAELVFAQETTPVLIAGWRDQLEGQQLQRIMDFLRPRARSIPFLAEVQIPLRREFQHA